MTGHDFELLLKERGLTYGRAGERLGVTRQTVARWTRKKGKIPAPVAEQFNRLPQFKPFPKVLHGHLDLPAEILLPLVQRLLEWEDTDNNP